MSPLFFVFSAFYGYDATIVGKDRAPEPVAPVYTPTLRIEAKDARVYVYNRANRNLLWSVAAFTQVIAPNLEEDVQSRFITQMKIVGDTAEVTAGGGFHSKGAGRYRVFLTTRKVEKVVSEIPPRRAPL